MKPEMLWESRDADAELTTRFGFPTSTGAADWARKLMAGQYGIEVTTIDRMVISAHNLMIWLTMNTGQPLMMKICRLAEAHDWLCARAAMVGWLAKRDMPVAAPVPTVSGGLQVLWEGRSVGVQPVLAGGLLAADDLDQVRTAGSTLARLHTELARWPEANLLADVRPVAGEDRLWVYPRGHLASVPANLRERLEQRIVELPELPRQPVHGDFRGANLLYREGKISGILDFEEARMDAAIVDLAHAVCLLGTWYHDWQPISPTAQQTFLGSYTAERPLTGAEQVWLAPLVAWGMLRQGWWDAAAAWL